jgi:putative flavoprotein involved in K+ transport
MELPGSIDTAVVGAGQAGLIMSRLLTAAGREHVVLERRESLGGGWQDRWDAFRLVSPNFLAALLPDFPDDGADPDGFMTRDEMVGRMRVYADVVAAPVVSGTEVRRLATNGAGGRRFQLETSAGPLEADTVVVSTGAFHVPRIPPAAAGFAPRMTQVHSHHYRNPGQLPPGGVLVVGSGQTGVQLAEELHEAGRQVVLATGKCGRMPRRYRGRDCFWWIRQLVEQGEAHDARLPTVGELPNPRAKFACNPHLSGHGGGHDTNLRQMGLDGIRLAGRFAGADGTIARFEPDLAANLQFADEFFDVRFRPIIDKLAERAGIEVGDDDRVWPQYNPPELTEQDVAASGISTVLWTTGYAPDYGWLDLPILDEFGVPCHVRGVSDIPGLLFLGMLFQHDNASANLGGVARDAEYLSSRI